MCGDINRQPIVYKLAGHLPEAGLASSDALYSRTILWHRAANCRSSDIRLPISKDIAQMICRRLSRTSADSRADLEVHPVGSPSTDSRPMFTMFGRASPDYPSMVLRFKTSGGHRENVHLARRCTDCRLESNEDDRPRTPVILRSSPELTFFRPKTHRIGVGSFMWHRHKLAIEVRVHLAYGVITVRLSNLFYISMCDFFFFIVFFQALLEWVLTNHKSYSDDSDQTRWVYRLSWVFAGRTDNNVGFVVLRLIFTLYRDVFTW